MSGRQDKELGIFWDFDCVMRGEGEKAHFEGTLFLTNIQQFYERPDRTQDEEPDVMKAMLGPRPELAPGFLEVAVFPC